MYCSPDLTQYSTTKSSTFLYLAPRLLSSSSNTLLLLFLKLCHVILVYVFSYICNSMWQSLTHLLQAATIDTWSGCSKGGVGIPMMFEWVLNCFSSFIGSPYKTVRAQLVGSRFLAVHLWPPLDRVAGCCEALRVPTLGFHCSLSVSILAYTVDLTEHVIIVALTHPMGRDILL